MEKKKKIIFAGGGTGGHIMPLISLYNYLNESHNYEYMWLGERDSLEQKIAQKYSIDFHEIAAGKIRRYFDIRNFYEPLKNLTGIVQALYCIVRYKGDIIFSKGGFVSVPVCIAGWILRKKIYIHESDTKMGLANTIASKFATKVFYSFPFEGNKSEKHIYTGHILNGELIDHVRSLSKEENEHLNVLLIAGSQGSEKIFESLLQILPDCQDIQVHVILGTSKNTVLKEKLEKYENVSCYGFLSPKELSQLYQKVDIAISRGSSTLWELFYFGIHTLIIPLPYTGKNHQYYNALYFQEKYGFDILDEENNLPEEILHKLQNYTDFRKVDLNLEGFFDGVKKIEDEITI